MTKFLFVCAENFDVVPSAERIKSELKCTNVIDLSLSIDELVIQAEKTRYKAGPLQRIYSSICADHSHYFCDAWGIDSEKYYTRKLKNVFLVSEDADARNLMWATLKSEFRCKAFSLDDNGIDQIVGWIHLSKYLTEQFERHYLDYKKNRDRALEILSNVVSDDEKNFYADLEVREQTLLLLCKKEAQTFAEKINVALNSGWN